MQNGGGWILLHCYTPRSNSADCHHNIISLAISSPMFCGLPIPALRPNTNPAGGSGLWHSALKFGPLTIAIRGTAIFSVAIRLKNTAISLYSVMNFSAEFSNRVEFSPRHFTSRGPLFELSYIFDARLLKCKTDTRRNV
jgi:hypothetical protein